MQKQPGFQLKAMLVSIVFLSIGAARVSAQKIQSDSLKQRAVKLRQFLETRQIEKAYLHLDKPYYAAGDTIYFKAYVVTGDKNKLSPLSKVLYAELIDPHSKIIKTHKLELTGGISWGDFDLPDTAIAGSYRLRAYTKLTLNNPDLVFEKFIPVSSSREVQTPKSSPAQRPPDLQFFPESGPLVAGIMSKVAFKALNAAGKGINVSGVIKDDGNKVVTTFASAHLGMGSFNFVPADEKTYYAEYTFADGRGGSSVLPIADENTIAMAVTDSVSKLSVFLKPGDLFFKKNRGKPFGLFILSNGKLTTVFDTLDNPDKRFDIQKKGLAAGVTQLTLISATGEPLCERLVFIPKNDGIRISVATDKPHYLPREKTHVSLHAEYADGSPVSAHFSVSTTADDLVAFNDDNELNILTYLLLTSNLKGNIESPGYYFNSTDEQHFVNLDLVMLTHGYRRFTWKSILDDSAHKAPFMAEQGLSISGVAQSFGGKPINNGTVTLIAVSGGSLLSDRTDSAGLFRFNNLAFYDTAKFVLNAINAKGHNNTQLVYSPDKPLPIAPLFVNGNDTLINDVVKAYLLNSKKRNDDFALHNPNLGIQLKEVKVKGIKKANYRTASLLGPGHADKVIENKELQHSIFLGEAFSGIGGLTIDNASSPAGGFPRTSTYPSRPFVVVVDGLVRPKTTGMNDISPGQVERVEIIKGSAANIYGFDAGGAIIITTKQGSGINPADIASRGVLPLSIMGYYKARTFYSPVYNKAEKNYRTQDFRSTLMWLPEVQTDKNGNASFEYYNADSTGSDQIRIEGITSDGYPLVKSLTYQIGRKSD